MDARGFNDAFDATVGELARSVIDGEQRGRSVFLRSGDLTLAVLRVELRHRPPPALTLFVRHNCMRTMDEALPEKPSTNPRDYPVQIAPSDASLLLAEDWQYRTLEPMGRPADTIDWSRHTDEDVTGRLQSLADSVAAVLDQLPHVLTAERLLFELTHNGNDWWSERMWIEDLTRWLDAT